MTADTETLDCGHEPTWTVEGPHQAGTAKEGREEHTTGYGTLDGKKLCFPCAEKEECRRFLASNPGDKCMGYLSEKSGQLYVTSWTGAILARVTVKKVTPQPYVGGKYVGPGNVRVTFQAVDDKFRVWSGTSPATEGTYCRLRLTKQVRKPKHVW